MQLYHWVGHRWGHDWGTANHYTPSGYVGQSPFEFYSPWAAQLWGSGAGYLP